MRRYLLALILALAWFAGPAQAQQNTGTTRRIIYGSSLPATCSPNTGDVYFKTAATIGPYYCSATNTWTSMGGGAGSLTGTGVADRVAYWSGTSALTGSAGFTFTPGTGLLTATNATLSGLTANSFLYSGVGGALTTTTAPTNGKLLIGSTGAAPVSATLTAGSSKLGITNGAGSISLDVVPANITITDLAGTLTAIKGGTGLSSFTLGDTLYASSTTALSKLGIGTAGQVLTVSGSLPVWSDAAAASAHRLLSATHTDTTPATPVRGDVITAQTSGGIWTRLPIGSSGTHLRSDGTDASWSSVVLTTDVSGILPAANGGTGNGFTAFTGPASTTKTFTLPNASATILTDNAAVTAPQGGTGQTSYTIGDLLYASSTSALSKRGIGSAGDILTVTGGVPVWAAPSSAGAHAILSATHTDSAANAVSRGSLIYGNSTPAWAELVIGAANRALMSDGTDAAWGQVPLATAVSGTLPVTNGGTGLATATQGDILYASAANTYSALAKDANATRYLANTGTSNNPAWAQVALATGVSGTLPVANGGTGLTSGTSGGVLAYTASGTLASSGALTANLPVIGGGAGVAPTVGTRSGNTTAYVTTTGAQTSGDCVEIDANGNHIASGAACGTGSGGGAVDEIAPRTSYAVTAGKIWPGVHTGAGSTVKYWEGQQIMASLDADATWNLAWKMPATIPSGTPKLRLDALANTSSQNSKFQPMWACVSTSADPSSASLNDEGVQTGAWPASAADEIQQFDTTLDAASFCTAGQWLVMNMKFESTDWTVSVISTWNASIVFVP